MVFLSFASGFSNHLLLSDTQLGKLTRLSRAVLTKNLQRFKGGGCTVDAKVVTGTCLGSVPMWLDSSSVI